MLYSHLKPALGSAIGAAAGCVLTAKEEVGRVLRCDRSGLRPVSWATPDRGRVLGRLCTRGRAGSIGRVPRERWMLREVGPGSGEHWMLREAQPKRRRCWEQLARRVRLGLRWKNGRKRFKCIVLGGGSECKFLRKLTV
jgi:hypothetical protein